jgi:hypothetical protein
MSTVIDSLVVMLGLDSGDLTKKAPGASQALDKIEKSGEKVEKAVKQTSASVTDLSRGFSTLLGIIGGTVAFKSFLTDFVATNAQLDRLSKNLGISVPTISAWSNATEALGGSAQGLQGTLDMLSKSQTQLMLTGESSLIPYLSALGVSMADTTGKARPVTAILLDLADRFSHMDRTSANNMGRMMGIDQGTLNLLLQGRKELELQIARQKEHNAVTQKQAEAAQRLQTSIVGVKQGFEALGRSLLMQAMPAIEGVLHVFQRFVSWSQENREFIVDFLKVMAVGLTAVAIATAPISLTAIAILALGLAIALLWQDYQTWKSGGDSFINWGKWVSDIQKAIQAIDSLKSHIKSLQQTENDWIKKKTGIDILDHDRKAWAGTKKLAKSAGHGIEKFFGVSGVGSPKPPHYDVAEKVAARTGIAPAIIYAQMQHETGNFTNRGAFELHNYSGINVPGGKGQDYRNFKSDDDYADYYSDLLKRKYSGALGAQSADSFAKALKAGGYYGDTEANYSAGIKNYMGQDRRNYPQSIQGIPGAASMVAAAPQTGSGSSASGGNSTQLTINQLDIHTQATDADKIAKDMYQSLNYQLVGQANYGMLP